MSLATALLYRATPRNERAEFSHSLMGSSILLVGMSGELDAGNALSLSKYIEPQLETADRLVLDLRALEFFAIQGFSILHRINVMCSRYNLSWVVVAGAEVDRVLSICDPDGGLPVASTLDEAIAAAVHPPRSHLRLVPSD